jgi:hypothetical protein
VHAAVLQRADHLQASAVADVGQPRIGVAAEIPLQDAAVLGAVEDRAPFFQFADPLGGFLSVELRHPPLVEELAPFHRVAEVDLPAVPRIDVGQGGGDAPFRHDRVGLPRATCRRASPRAGPRPRSRPAGRAPRADHYDVVF